MVPVLPRPATLAQLTPPFIAALLVTVHNAWRSDGNCMILRRTLPLIPALLTVVGGVGIGRHAGQDLSAHFRKTVI